MESFLAGMDEKDLRAALIRALGEEAGESDSDNELLQRINDKFGDLPPESLIRDRVEAVLKILSDQERQVLRHRFGLIDGDAKSAQRTGELMGLDAAAVLEIETRSLVRLRKGER